MLLYISKDIDNSEQLHVYVHDITPLAINDAINEWP